MSGKKVVGYTIIAILLLVGTYIYFWALDFVNANLGISLLQAVDQELGAWQFTVWMMSCVLALIIVFNGAARDHYTLEPIASACFLAYTIASFLIGCSALTLNFPFNAFGSLNVQVTIDPTKLMTLFGGETGGGDPIPPITISLSLLQLLMISLMTVFAALRFLRALLKSMREAPEAEEPQSPAPKKVTGDLDFMRNVRRD
ncbi:MAG: hypothetical protein JW839_11150 [Candidatus Lokiarchaeota archaeon]|nr:hypothetical protein [Candidatus Lokiarchaeota archaeon]